MANLVIMPKLGFDMAEGTLVRWVIAEGSPVDKGAVLAEIETDKATVEVESTFTGTVRRHLVEEGSIVPVNTPIAVIGKADEPIDLGGLLGETSPGEDQKPALEPAKVEPQVSLAEGPSDMQFAAGTREAAIRPFIEQKETLEAGQLPGGVRA